MNLSARAGRRRANIGVSSFNLLGGRRVTVRVQLTRQGRAQARAGRRIDAVVAARDGAGNSHRVKVRLRLLRS